MKKSSVFALHISDKNGDLLPSRTTVSDQGLDEVYNCVKGALISFLSTTPTHGTVCLDTWCDKYRRLSYITFTYHCMIDWELKSITLKTAPFLIQHTGENIKRAYDQTIDEFGLNNKEITLCVDGAANMTNAAKLLNMDRFHCIAHRFHLLISTDLLKHNSMTPLVRLIKKLKDVQKTLLYKNNELKKISDDLHQAKIAKLLLEYRELGNQFVLLFENLFLLPHLCHKNYKPHFNS